MSERGNKVLRFLDWHAGIPMTCGAALWRKIEKPDRKNNREHPHIGIICLGAIGDLLLLSALVNGLRQKFPKATIDIIASRANANAVPLIPDIAFSVAFPVASLHKIIKYLRHRHYDYLFDSTQWARIGNILSNTAGASTTIGFRTKGQWRSLGYDYKVNHDSNVHELENFLALGRAVWPDFTGHPILRAPIEFGPLHENPANTIYCHMWCPPGKGKELKEWPSAYWAELIHELILAGFDVALTGSNRDVDKTENFCREFFPVNPKVQNLAGKTALPRLAALFSKAAGVVSINTGIMHLAALLGVPVIGLHGATNPLRWGPKGDKAISLLPHHGMSAYLDLGFEYPKNALPSMDSLPVLDVLEALKNLGVIGL